MDELLNGIKADGDACLKLFIDYVQDHVTTLETSITKACPSLAVLNNTKLLVDVALQAMVLQKDRKEVSSPPGGEPHVMSLLIFRFADFRFSGLVSLQWAWAGIGWVC